MAERGWYRDPYPGGESRERYFDGVNWSSGVRAKSSGDASDGEQAPQPGPLSPGWGPTGTQPSGGSNRGGNQVRAAVIASLVVAAIVVLGLIAVVLRGASYDPNISYTYDALASFCADGHMRACERLYWDSPLGSDYEMFGGTCGNRLSVGFGPNYDIQWGDSFGPIGECTTLFGDRYRFYDRFRHP